MFNGIKDSIKAKLYDFAYTPFMSSVVISWIIINHKYILIYFANYDLEKKLALLKGWDFAVHFQGIYIPYTMNIIEPILFGLFYVFIYPKISKFFYSYTLERNKELKEIKKEIEDKTPLTREEEKSLRQEMDRLTIERDEMQNRLTKTEQFYEEKYQKKVRELEFKEWEEPLNISPVLNPDLVENKIFEKNEEDDRTKILRFFYESNYKTTLRSNVLDQIVDVTKMARPKATIILADLIKENILLSDEYDYISITDLGNITLLNLFDKSIEF